MSRYCCMSGVSVPPLTIRSVMARLQQTRSWLLYNKGVAADLAAQSLLRALRLCAGRIVSHANLEETRRVPHDAGLEPHHFESSEHVVNLRRTFSREHLHGPRVWSGGSGLRRGVDRLGATALSRGRCGGRRGGA